MILFHPSFFINVPCDSPHISGVSSNLKFEIPIFKFYLIKKIESRHCDLWKDKHKIGKHLETPDLRAKRANI